MDTEKLLIGGAVLIGLLIAIPVIAPLINKKNAYDPVADSHKIQQLNNAIAAYGQQNGQYPPSLFYLSPDYLDDIPLTSTNRQFEYDPATGQVVNPSAPVVVDTTDPKNVNQRRRGGGGISPATDAMTGLGVAEELN